jgi:uncharacterized protein YlxW (UPF0749 family)
LFASELQATLLGVAALVTALGGVLATILGARRSRREERDKAEQDCVQRLRETRAESERLAEELHRVKMHRLE